MPGKPKLTTGANDRPKQETIAQTAPGLPDDSSTPVQVNEETVEKVRAKLKRDKPLPSESETSEDRSPSRRKDRARREPEAEGRKVPGAEEVEGAGAEEDTYD